MNFSESLKKNRDFQKVLRNYLSFGGRLQKKRKNKNSPWIDKPPWAEQKYAEDNKEIYKACFEIQNRFFGYMVQPWKLARQAWICPFISVRKGICYNLWRNWSYRSRKIRWIPHTKIRKLESGFARRTEKRASYIFCIKHFCSLFRVPWQKNIGFIPIIFQIYIFQIDIFSQRLFI